jgi:hypothetical protein
MAGGAWSVMENTVRVGDGGDAFTPWHIGRVFQDLYCLCAQPRYHFVHVIDVDVRSLSAPSRPRRNPT